MPRPPDWTEQEFETLLQHPLATDDHAAALLPRRSPGAVEVVRNFIHEYHRAAPADLSELMRRRLSDPSRPYTCPRCRVHCDSDPS